MALREKKKQKTERQILDAATIIFRRHGFDGTRMTDIAELAEVASKTLFNYFASKEQLVTALVLDWLDKHAEQMLEASELVFEDARDLLPGNAEVRLQLLEEERWLATMAAAHTDILVSYRWEQHMPTALLANRAARTRRIEAAQALGRITNDIPAARISRMYEALRDHVLGYWLMHPEADGGDLRTELNQAKLVFLKGISP